ncbi:LuxR family transcriptional regulator [Saccharopolyspora gloriosae]|uniref:LuxR family transcriptional regulator n=1 Tax=Saccharopolyspora gloriosae TaxID=455344 RepID=UPI001FB7A848|nr:LuxR family transcriptional regulator [Saccharopolyspora gloriosae]
MARERATVFGRDQLLTEITTACRRDAGALLLVRGRPGEGKSALLNAVAANWQRPGRNVLVANAAAEGGPCAIDALLNGVRNYLERGGDPHLLDAVAAVSRWRAVLDRTPQRALLPLVHELARAIGIIAARGPTMVIIEDVDRCDPTLSASLTPLVQRLRAVGCAVLVSSRTYPATNTAQLLSISDRVVDLEPLSETDVAALLGGWCAGNARANLDQTVVKALRAGLGSLFGNPGTVLSTLDHMRQQGRLVLVDQHFCLSPLTEPIALPEQHPLVQAVISDGDETERLAAVLALPTQVRVNDLPVLTAAAAVRLEPSGKGLDRLVASGVLVVDSQDQVRFAVPALAATLRNRAGQEWAWSLHTALSRRLLAQLERNGQVIRAKLADHLMRAGPHFRSEPGVQVLVEEADRIAHADPECAANWYRAALRQVDADDARWPRLLRALLRLRMSLGQYRELTEDVGSAVPALPTADTGGRARENWTLLVSVGLSWLTALMHDERAQDDSPQLFAALGAGTRFDAEVRRFSSALFDGRLDEAAAQLNTLFGADHDEGGEAAGFGEVLVLLKMISGDSGEFLRAWSLWQRRSSRTGPAAKDPDRLREAGAMTDYATALELILGDDYCRPSRGSVLRYQEVLHAYLTGEWDSALSLARLMETELSANRGAPARYRTRAIAAEICAARGEQRRAVEWLDGVPQVMAGGHVVAWVRLGVRYADGARGEALDEGWQDYLRYRERGSPAGLERLLERLVELSLREGRTEFAEEVLSELTELDACLCSTGSEEALRTAQARVRRSAEHAEHALELARKRGDVPRLGGLYLLLAELAAEPADRLNEAYALGKRLDWHFVRTTAQELMRTHRVALPRSRTRQERFSSTENRIIELVSDGFTNRQIAVTVQVSEKTVESHLTKLFARTGCRSRVELAAASLEGRLLAMADS